MLRAAAYARQLSMKIGQAVNSKPEYEWDAAYNADDYAKMMAAMLPLVRKLATMRNSEEPVFEVMLELCENTLGGLDLDRKGASGYSDAIEHYELLDDALVEAIITLWKSRGIQHIDKTITNISKDGEYRAAYGLDGFCERSLQLLKEIRTIQVLQMKTRKALATTPLPPENIQQIEDVLIAAQIGPLEHYVASYLTPRPPTRIYWSSDSARQWDAKEHVWLSDEERRKRARRHNEESWRQ